MKTNPQALGRGLPDAAEWLRNVGSGYVDTAIGGLAFLVLTPLFVAHLGAEGYAVWVLGHTIAFYLRLADLGIGETQVRFHARYASLGRDTATRDMMATVTVALLFAAVVAGAMGLVIALGSGTWWPDMRSDAASDLKVVIVVLAIQVMVAIPASAFDNVYEALERFDVRNARSIILRIVAASVQFVLLRRGHGIMALVLVELVVTCARAALDIVIIQKLAPTLLATPLGFHGHVWRRIRHFLLWSSVDDLVAEGGSYVDELLLVFLLPLALLTPYSLAGALSAAIMMAVQPIAMTFFPLAASLQARQRTGDLTRLLVGGTRIASMIAAPIAIFVACFGADVLAVWVPGTGDDASPTLFLLLSMSGLVSVYLWPASVVLASIGRVRTVVALLVVELALEITLMLLLAPRFDLVGIAVANLVSNAAIGLLVELPLVARATGIELPTFLRATAGRLLPAVLASSGVAIALLYRHPRLDLLMLVAAASALAVVFASVAWLGSIRSERKGLLELWRALRDGEWIRITMPDADRKG